MKDQRRDNRLLAERIVTRLFTNGQKQTAQRLVLSRNGADLGGWAFGPAVDQVFAELELTDGATTPEDPTP